MYKKVNFGPTKTSVEKRKDGSILYRNLQPLRAYPNEVTFFLDQWSTEKPDHVFLAQRDSDGEWEKLTYSEANLKATAIAQYFLQKGFGDESTVMLLSENSISNALVVLGALKAGLTYAHISPAYSLKSDSLEKLDYCVEQLKPDFVFAEDAEKYSNALKSIQKQLPEVSVICQRNSPGVNLSELLKISNRQNLPKKDNPIAKILFTSGSTGSPKGVIIHHSMWSASLTQITQCLPFMADNPPVFVDWLPWHHTFGGNHNFGLTLMHGGTLYIDEGIPSPSGIETTVKNLKGISPTAYFNVPKGFEMLLDYLEEDTELSKTFFKNLEMLFYAGAGLAQPIWDRWEALAIKTIEMKIPIISGLGCTEAGPSAMFANWPGAFSGCLGVPVAGLDVKLTPVNDKLEARYKGPNITAGYWKAPEVNKDSFDEEGYYKTGDAVRFLDEENPDLGLLFDGRIKEDFKLSSGTWVSVGVIRQKLMSMGDPIIHDIVLTGLNENFIGALVFVNHSACEKLEGRKLAYEELLSAEKVNAFIDQTMELFNGQSKGSSTKIVKYSIAPEAPDALAGEITDKGSINQNKILKKHDTFIAETFYS
ncbi:feruloyl-CoA synthase [Jiulongibacter sediminis]|uniref:Feruloyl-CoA synthase n=1 Tax=Jiulongibacter sediminis TaxID=1605367 RepID=A0A0P7BRC7_9BACT|nr:feruloyl-CoA synthase [Jiulongibacter sediminis]KPM46819.1 feruloyl-CoA synthase [Jiulongibacter sediminis]TBX21719.1 feruloyl-CoA synthase [Jiulongibacter sediminis]